MEKEKQLQMILYDYLCLHAENRAQSDYLIDDFGKISYGEGLKIVQSLMAQLSSLGAKKGDLIALRASRNPYTVLLSVAIGAIGAVCVLTDSHFCVADYLKTNADVKADFSITDENGCWTALHNAEETRLTFTQNEDNSKSAKALRDFVNVDDPFMIIFTSGSTEKSKAVVLSHKNCVANPVDAMPLFCEDFNDVAISLLPLHHVFGYAVTACALFCGHSVVFPKDIDTSSILKCIERHSVSVLYSVPTLFLNMLADDLYKQFDLKSLRLGLMAGGPFTAEQLGGIEDKLGLQLMPGYGMSECVGISTMKYGDSVEERAAGVGRLYPMTSVVILDNDGKEVKVDESGEICAKGPTLMLGYYGANGVTKNVFDANGFLHTGDLGHFDEDDILHIDGRKKEIIVRGGENLSVGKIERALLCLPSVLSAVVVGIKDSKYGEIPACMVVLKENCQLTKEELQSQLGATLTKQEIPSVVKIATSIPLLSSGKPNKAMTKKLLEAEPC